MITARTFRPVTGATLSAMRVGRHRRVQTVDRAGEPVPGDQRAHRVAVPRPGRERPLAALERAVLRERDDATRSDEVVRGAAELHADARRQILRRKDRVERAVLPEQLRGGLLADPAYSREAIRRIAAEDR